LETLPALFVVDAHGIIGAHVTAAPDTELEATLADLIHRRCLFGNAQGMDQGQYLDRHPHP
jgi:hypothetical protein